MKIGGFDPSVIREFSGIYSPFVKALKELVSNAFDADAELVRVELAEDLTSLEVFDDGIGMTPFEFHTEFTKIGGSYKRFISDLTKSGRPKIGNKGIGFLAVARYCGKMQVVSTTRRKHSATYREKLTRGVIDLRQNFGVPIASDLLSKRLTVTAISLITPHKKRKLRKSEYKLLSNARIRLLTDNLKRNNDDVVEIRYTIDCRDLEFNASIDFDYLLSLENKADLSELDEFCSLDIYALPRRDSRIQQQYTKVALGGLKPFVIRDLKAPRKAGRVRNVESESGLDQFIWHLSRCTPIKYDFPESIATCEYAAIKPAHVKAIQRMVVHMPGREEIELRRPVWSTDSDVERNLEATISVKVAIECDGLQANGYILGHRSPIFPAEFRGIAVRVRSVQIGAPTFFGGERMLTGASRGMLSQITGEINVVQGLDAADALNPGRDSFYEENPHYKILRQEIVGKAETLGGSLGLIIEGMLQRLQVLSTVESALARATQYRNALLNLSLGINYYATNGSIDLHTFFNSSTASNGLSQKQNYDNVPGPRLAGFRVVPQSELPQDHLVDFARKTIYLDLGHDRWSNRIFLLGEYYDVIPKAGGNNDPLCEIDTITKRLYVNWGHTLRQQMGDSAFLKSAVAWKLSYLACNGDIEAMMDLALKLLTFNGA
jgi:hypothetical protein